MSQELIPYIKTVDAVVCPEDRWSKMRWTTTATTNASVKFPTHNPNAPHVELSEEEIKAIMRMIGL
jgi:hypothetical protein